MIAGKIAFSTKIKVVMMLVIKYAINDLNGGYANWTGRKPSVFVCIIRRFNLKMLVKDTVYREIAKGKL